MENNDQRTELGSCCVDAEELLIPEGTIQEYDAAQGALTFEVLHNKGTIVIRSSDPSLTVAELQAKRLVNEGSIVSELPTLSIATDTVQAKSGTISAHDRIIVKSPVKHLQIAGGTFKSAWLELICDGDLKVFAERIDGQLELTANKVSLGVSGGDLNIARHTLTDDPLYYNTGGSVSIPPTSLAGTDVFGFASQDITVGAIDNTGGGNGIVGTVFLQAGIAFKDPHDNLIILGCPFGDCASIVDQIQEQAEEIQDPTAGTVTVNTIRSKAVNIIAGTVIANGQIECILESGEQGVCSIISPNVSLNAKVKAHLLIGTPTGVTSGSITTKAVESEKSIFINGGQILFGSGGGGLAASQLVPSTYTVNTGKLTAKHKILIVATSTVKTGQIELFQNDPPESQDLVRNIRIHANVGVSNAPVFKLGGGGSNGTGPVTIHGTEDLFGVQHRSGALWISNGLDVSTNKASGDIIVDGAAISLLSEGDGTPGVVLEAGSGKITFNGLLKVDGTAALPAGFIVAMADEVKSSSAQLTANDLVATNSTPPTIIIAANKLTLTGDLALECNGTAPGTSIKLVPKDSEPINFIDLQENFDIRPKDPTPTENPFTVGGAGSLSVKANSPQGSVLLSGKPLKFNNSGTTSVTSQGVESKITFTFAGSPSGQNSLIFTGGAVTASADNPQGNAGSVIVQADKVNNTTTVSLHANALASGNGGQVSVTLDRGNLSLGTSAGSFAMAATSMGTGNGGSITIEDAEHNGTIILDSTFSTGSLNVSVLGTSGDGGNISIHADHLTNNASAGNSGLVANGSGSGKGGTISFKLTDTITIGGAPGLACTAVSTGTGDGGQVDVTSTQGSVTIDGASINVNGGTNGKGGGITVKAPGAATTLIVNGTLDASGNGTGRGGSIKLNAAGTLSVDTAQVHSDGGPRGSGGTVDLTSGADLTISAGQVSAAAGNTGTNAGGKIVITTIDTGDLTVNTGLNVNGSGFGKGGTLGLDAGGNDIFWHSCRLLQR